MLTQRRTPEPKEDDIDNDEEDDLNKEDDRMEKDDSCEEEIHDTSNRAGTAVNTVQ